MIIVNQDKDIIFNFENIDIIEIENPSEEDDDDDDDDGMFEILAITTSDNKFLLGEYKTEERAKEVLQEIMSAFSDFEYFKSTEESNKNNIGIKIFANYGTIDVYKMPKE